jgi:hypothetical protein
MFVRRPLGICEDMMRSVWLIREKILPYSFKSFRRYISEALHFIIGRYYLFFSVFACHIDKQRKVPVHYFDHDILPLLFALLIGAEGGYS